MNVNQLIDMIIRTVVRRAVNGGVNAGFDAMSNLGRKSRKAPPPEQHDPERERIREMRQARRAARSEQEL
ncbi:hypothetical protein KBY31_18620 [Ruegeria pomeroyi]|nr:hypothetical protein [Ruegeria pomeroyi]